MPTERSSFRFLVALVIPALLIAVPFQPGNGTGFDTYAAGRAIAIRRDAHKPAGFAHLHGLDEERKTITISDDEFGSWFSHIDHNPQRYIGYRVRLTGFVYKPSTLGAHEFELSRQFMSCCILDMTPFGFTTHYAKTAHLQEHDWVSVDATLVQGTYGIAGHTRQGADAEDHVAAHRQSRAHRLFLLAVTVLSAAIPATESTGRLLLRLLRHR